MFASGGFKKFNDLRLRNPALRTLIAVGGWNEGSVGFSNICRDPVLRARFVDNMFNFVRAHNFNGVDIDWEFPAQRGGTAADKVCKYPQRPFRQDSDRNPIGHFLPSDRNPIGCSIPIGIIQIALFK
jgi:GH18 family chitinase